MAIFKLKSGSTRITLDSEYITSIGCLQCEMGPAGGLSIGTNLKIYEIWYSDQRERDDVYEILSSAMEKGSSATSSHTIHVSKEQLSHIRREFQACVMHANPEKMIKALKILGWHWNEEDLTNSLEKSYKNIVDSLGKQDNDGSIEVDLDIHSDNHSNSNFYDLHLILDKDPNEWSWVLNLKVYEEVIY